MAAGNAGRGAPLGNKNAAKGHAWREALRYALAQPYDDVERGQALKAVAKTVVRHALKGDIHCIQEIGNRLDGRPAQSVELSSEEGNPVQFAIVRWIDAEDGAPKDGGDG